MDRLNRINLALFKTALGLLLLIVISGLLAGLGAIGLSLWREWRPAPLSEAPRSWRPKGAQPIRSRPLDDPAPAPAEDEFERFRRPKATPPAAEVIYDERGFALNPHEERHR